MGARVGLAIDDNGGRSGRLTSPVPLGTVRAAASQLTLCSLCSGLATFLKTIGLKNKVPFEWSVRLPGCPFHDRVPFFLEDVAEELEEERIDTVGLVVEGVHHLNMLDQISC